MQRNKKKAFTLIELIAVLVILAVIALIVTPLALNIVKKAKDSANKRSVDAYGKAVELAVAVYLLDNGDYPTNMDDLTVEYSGNEVVCNVKTLNEDGSIYLSECTVNGIEVKDSKTDDGWYHFGKTTIVTYDAYNIGDTVTYNGMDFYVIANSDVASDSVTLLKAEPLTVDEVNEYGAGHINKYTHSHQGTSGNYENYGYGGMAYYSSSTCGANGLDGCTMNYNLSEVKYAVDAWATDNFNANDLTEDSLGYKARLLTFEELTTNLGYDGSKQCTGTCWYGQGKNVPTWVYNSNYSYWTMSPYADSASYVLVVGNHGNVYSSDVLHIYVVVRPVVTLLKSSL